MHGKVLYFFLAGEIVRDFQHGHFDVGEQHLAEFLQTNPYPEYAEVIEKIVREASKLKSGQPADEWHQAVDEHGLTGVHIHAPGGWQAAVAQLYQVCGIPSYFLVDPDGLLAGRVDGVSDTNVAEGYHQDPI